MTVTLGQYLSQGASGWTTFVQDGGGTIRYVSNADGNDSNNGQSSVANPSGAGGVGPWKTLSHAATQFNNGDSGNIINYRDNWLLLKEGDSFQNGDVFDAIQVSGKDAQHPFVVGSYDVSNPTVVSPGTGGARPIVNVQQGQTGLQSAGGAGRSSGDFWAIVGLFFYSYQTDPYNNTGAFILNPSQNAGITQNLPATWWLIENCRIFGTNLQISCGNSNYQNGTLIIRRCVLDHMYNVNTGEGALVGLFNTFTFEENTVDHTGWEDDAPYFAMGSCSVSASTTLGISSGSYVSGTGVVTLNLASSAFNGKTTLSIQATGTGANFSQVNDAGQSVTVSGSTCTFTIATGLTITSFTGGNVATPAIVTIAGTNIANTAYVHFTSGATNGISNGTQYVVYNVSGSTFGLLALNSLGSAYTAPVATTGTSPSAVITWDVPRLSVRGFAHSCYFQSYSVHAEWTGQVDDSYYGVMMPVTARGNVISRDQFSAPLFKPGGTIINNFFTGIGNAVAVGLMWPSPVTVYQDNVHYSFQSAANGVLFGGNEELDYYNIGTVTCTNNLFSNTPGGGYVGFCHGGVTGSTLNNNIAWKWGSPTQTFNQITGSIASLGSISGTFPNAVGAPYKYGSITGTSYASATGYATAWDLSAINASGPFDNGQFTLILNKSGSPRVIVVATVASGNVTSMVWGNRLAGSGVVDTVGTTYTGSLPLSGNPISFTTTSTQIICGFDTFGGVSLTGGSGSGAAARVTLNSSAQIMAVDVNSDAVTTTGYKVGDVLTGTLGGTTFTVTVTQVLMYNVPLSGGSGDGNATMLAIIDTTGVIQTFSNGFSGTGDTNYGSGYLNSDTLTGTFGGTGFSVHPSIVSNTLTPNVVDLSGTNSEGYIDPNRNLGQYAVYAGLGTTDTDFYNALLLNEKHNWNPQLTADVINDWFQAGFAMPSSATLLPQACL